jgi:hypothetical protein
LNSRDVVACFERNEAAAAVDLFREPIGVAAQIDAFDTPLELNGILGRRCIFTGSKAGAFIPG